MNEFGYARRVGAKPPVPQGMKPRDWIMFDRRLGKVPDHVIAEDYRVSVTPVRNARILRGIDSLRKQKERRTREILANESDLGLVSDVELGERLGISKSTIFDVRREMGVPRRKECKECGDELPLTEFYRNHKMKDGHVNQCKRCQGHRGALNRLARAQSDKKQREANALLMGWGR